MFIIPSLVKLNFSQCFQTKDIAFGAYQQLFDYYFTNRAVYNAKNLDKKNNLKKNLMSHPLSLTLKISFIISHSMQKTSILNVEAKKDVKCE